MMSEKIDISPAPIQRNRRDVAIDLMKLFFKNGNWTADEITEDKISELYKKYYKIALECDKL